MACCLFGTKPLPEPILIYCQFDPLQQIHFSQNTKLSFSTLHLKMLSAKWQPFCSGLSVFTHLVLGYVSVFVNVCTFQTHLNTLRPRQNGRRFPDDIFTWIFFNENVWIPIKISLRFVPKVPINNIPALVQIMAWRRPGDKPLSEPMMVSLLTHICVARPQWVNDEYLEIFLSNCTHMNATGTHQWLCEHQRIMG